MLSRGTVEHETQKNLIRRGYIKGIIGLPANLFYGTGIPACIVVMDKEGASTRQGIFMIDASKGFIKDGPKNRLREMDIDKIVDVFNKQTEHIRCSRAAMQAPGHPSIVGASRGRQAVFFAARPMVVS